MSRTARFAILVLCLSVLSLIAPDSANAQRRGAHRPVARARVVFVGGYYYDPFFGPYPWWPRGAYPYPYYPIYDRRADVRVLVTPRETMVYVDGFYAGIVDDFDGFFQRLPLPPGGHDIGLYLDGYRSFRQRLYLAPGSSLNLHHTMERLSAGEAIEPPPFTPPLPSPPPGTFLPPRTPPRMPLPPPQAQAAPTSAAFGSLALRVQPGNADVTIDAERWVSSDGEHFLVQVPAGRHRVEVSKAGYQRFSTEIEVREGETVPLNVSLLAGGGPKT